MVGKTPIFNDLSECSLVELYPRKQPMEKKVGSIIQFCEGNMQLEVVS